MVVGAIAPNAHEGSRSEYLAQYVFASFGAAVAIPHQEDSGIDLHCTLTERVGQRAWPRSYFSVQVKSTTDAWDFKGAVQWLIEYPLPLFLCVVDKASTRLRVYHTCPRFYSWALPARTYKAARDLLGSPRWQRAYNAGARPQRPLWASTGTKDPQASDVLYVKALAAPLTVNTMPEGTLKALADHGELGAILPADGGDGEEVLAQFAKAGVDVEALASQLQDEGAKAFVKSWHELMEVIVFKSADLGKAG